MNAIKTAILAHSGERVTVTTQTKETAEGLWSLVIYSDGATGWEHPADFLELEHHNDKLFFYFHTGRGGPFNNPGHTKFVRLIDEGQIEAYLYERNEMYFLERDELGRFANVYTNHSGRELISLRDFKDGLKCGFLRLEWDTIYNTDTFKTIDELTPEDLYLLEQSDAADSERAIDLYTAYFVDPEN